MDHCGRRGVPAGVVLAAGGGTRLRPLTDLRPKALCPVDNRPLVDWALERLRSSGVRDIAVNVHHHQDQMVDHLRGRGVHLSIEGEALGTAGALGRLRDWLGGRAVLLTNADAWSPSVRAPGRPGGGRTGLLDILLDGWDGHRPRLLCGPEPSPRDFGAVSYVGSALLPWSTVRDLVPEPSGLYETSWRALHERGALDLVVARDDVPMDCGTPGTYLAANLRASGGRSVVGAGAVVEGELVRSVVWPGARVGRHERLVDSIRAGGLTLGPLRLIQTTANDTDVIPL